MLASIAKSNEEKREMLRNYKIPKICIDYDDLDFNEMANIAIETKQRRLAVTATVQLTDEETVDDEIDVSDLSNQSFSDRIKRPHQLTKFGSVEADNRVQRYNSACQ